MGSDANINHNSSQYLDTKRMRSSVSTASFSSMCSEKSTSGKLQHSAININNTMTWISFVLPERKDFSDSVILFIPGNPGAIEFYDTFLQSLFQQCKIPIIGISHAGHNLIPSNGLLVKRVFKELNPDTKSSDKHVYTLEEQVTHKLSFIQQYIDPKKKIIIVAHSLGSYVTLQMLKRLRNKSTHTIKQIILLFPVFERTMETTSGKFWVPFTKYMKYPAIKTTKCLPPPVKKSLIEIIAQKRRFSSSSKESLSLGISSLVTPIGLRNMIQIARDLSNIGSLGELENVISENKKKLTFYYGANDQWTPLSFYKNMKKLFPDVDIRLDDKSIDHAFVLHSSARVAPLVNNIISEKLTEEEIDSGSLGSYNFPFSLSRAKSYKSGKKRFVDRKTSPE